MATVRTFIDRQEVSGPVTDAPARFLGFLHSQRGGRFNYTLINLMDEGGYDRTNGDSRGYETAEEALTELDRETLRWLLDAYRRAEFDAWDQQRAEDFKRREAAAAARPIVPDKDAPKGTLWGIAIEAYTGGKLWYGGRQGGQWKWNAEIGEGAPKTWKSWGPAAAFALEARAEGHTTANVFRVEATE